MSDQKRSIFFADTLQGCALEAYPVLLVAAWQARYNATRRTINSLCWQREGNTFVKHLLPLAVYFIPRSHPQYDSAVKEAHAIAQFLNLGPYDASYYRSHLADLSYSESALESLPGP